MVPDRLYHYTTREIAIEKILPTMALRLGPLGETNDPRETKNWLPGFGLPPTSNPFVYNRLMNEVTRAYNHVRQKEWFALCVTCDAATRKLPEKTHIDFHLEFLNGYARSRMWALYAENHQGICLEFDGSRLHAAVKAAAPNALCGKVKYADQGETTVAGPDASPYFLSIKQQEVDDPSRVARRHIRRFYRATFLRKSRDWSSEYEFRWLVHSQSGGLFVKIADALTAIIVGANMHKAYYPSLRGLCPKGIRLERMEWTHRVPQKHPIR